jgi:hypothetical protein
MNTPPREPNVFASVSRIFWLLYSDVCYEKLEVHGIGTSKERNEEYREIDCRKA